MILTGDLDVLDMYVDSQKKRVTKYLARRQVEWAGNFVIGRDCLDVGCGRGVLEALYAKQAKSFRSCDVYHNAKHSAWFSVRPDNCYAEGLSSHYDENSFDTVFMLGVLEHTECPKTSLEEVGYILRPGGVLVTVEPEGLIWDILNQLPLKSKNLIQHARWGDIRNPMINKMKLHPMPEKKCIIPGLFWGYVYKIGNL